MNGTSYNIYDASRGRWYQTWVDNRGRLLVLDGGLVDRRMVLTGQRPSPSEKGRTLTDRVTWAPLENGQVRQHWEVSSDGGSSWRTVFDGIYSKKDRRQSGD